MHSNMLQDETEKTELLKAIGGRVRAARQAAGLTMRQLAEQAELSPRFVAQLEAGSGNISISRLAQVALALKQPLHLLVPPATGDASLPAQVWQLLAQCQPTDWQALRDWLQARFGRSVVPFVALVGLRGAGKSTIGPQLARQLKLAFVEVDSCIETAAGMSLGQIFALHGEDYYRRLEREVLGDLFAQERGCVLATGGSLVTDAASWQLVRQRCFTVWLRATPQEHMTRVLQQGDTRPMKDNPSAMAELKALLARREPLYAQADLVLKTSQKTPQEVVQRIVKEVNARG